MSDHDEYDGSVYREDVGDSDVGHSDDECANIQSKGKEVVEVLEGGNCDGDCVNSADEDSLHGSDGDEYKWPAYNPMAKNSDAKFEVGMLFSSKEEFKEAILNLSILNGKTVKFTKNDKRRCKVICRRPNCPFSVYVSTHEGINGWQIKSIEKHTCTWNYHSRTLTSTVIAKRFVNKIKVNPKINCSVFRKEVIDDLKLHVSKPQAKKAMKKAHQLIYMNMEEQFNKIWDYSLEVANSNAQSTISILTTTDPDLEGRKRFLRLYVCFEACKKGFLSGCRPIIGVDGCFLKGEQGGQLLTAVGLDANNSIFPIAWAVVETENRSSWEWFFLLLSKDLNILENQENFTFISDKQKGLLPAFENILPNVTNRFCVRHLQQNFRLAGFCSMALRNALWAAARATTMNQFTFRMKELENLSMEAFRWLSEKDPSAWSRSHFNFTPVCDTLLNNICECFNSYILDARELPIVSMLENIRTLVMSRMLNSKETALQWRGKLCPRIKEILGKNMHDAASCIVHKSDDNRFEIITMHGAQYKVDLKCKSCSCRKWELSGIPCDHSCAAIHMIMGDCEDFVNPCYLIETYRRSYDENIKPLNGIDEWPISMRIPPLPPIYGKAKRGRPSKKRRRSADEGTSQAVSNKLGRANVQLRCSKCRQSGHNSSTCDKRARSEVFEIATQNENTTDISTQSTSGRNVLVYTSRKKTGRC